MQNRRADSIEKSLGIFSADWVYPRVSPSVALAASSHLDAQTANVCCPPPPSQTLSIPLYIASSVLTVPLSARPYTFHLKRKVCGLFCVGASGFIRCLLPLPIVLILHDIRYGLLILYGFNSQLCFESVIVLLSTSHAKQTPFAVLGIAEPYYDS